MLNASASSVRVGDKVVLQDSIPLRVLQEHGNVRPRPTGEVLQWLHAPGTVWGVRDVGAGHVTLGIHLQDVLVTSFKDHVFEKYFAVKI